MQSKFGLKDLVLVLLVLGVGVLVFLGMMQDDRKWKELQQTKADIGEMKSTLGRLQSSNEDQSVKVDQVGREIRDLERSIDEKLAAWKPVVTIAPTTNADNSGDTNEAKPDPADRGHPAWARPGVAISWQPAFEHVTDPTGQPGFSRGGEVTELINAQPSTVMPLVYKDVYGAWVFERVVEYLAKLNPQSLVLEGVLADAWQYSPDGTWLRVHIHPRARFSDGEPVKSDDVLWTFEWMRNPQVEAERPRSITDVIDSITRVDDKTVEFTFKEVIFTNLDAAMNTFPILPKHVYENFTAEEYNRSTGRVVGSGPFRFRSVSKETQWAPPEPIVLERNEAYWGPKPAYERLRFVVISDDQGRMIAFDNASGDVTQPSSLQYVTKIKDKAWLERSEAHSWYNIRSGYSFIGWNCDKRDGKSTPFADRRVRRAMTMMLDRDKVVVHDLYEGLARTATGSFPSSTPQANPEIKPWPYDLEASRRLLAEAGWVDRDGSGILRNEAGDPFRFEFSFAKGSELTDKLAKYLKDQCAIMGIECTLRTMDWSVLMQEMDRRNFDAITMGWSPSRAESDPQQIWHSRYIQNQGDNFAQWNNPEADRLIEEGRQELDPEKRLKIWHRLHTILHEEQPYTFLVERPWNRFVSKRIGNFTEYRNGFQYEELFVKSGGSASAVEP
ncbi:MAG: ABC transporter substrate-binding protein [Phycisphaerales bacterium]